MNVLPLAAAIGVFVALLIAKRSPPTAPENEVGGEETVEAFEGSMGHFGRPMLYARVGQDGSDA